MLPAQLRLMRQRIERRLPGGGAGTEGGARAARTGRRTKTATRERATDGERREDLRHTVDFAPMVAGGALGGAGDAGGARSATNGDGEACLAQDWTRWFTKVAEAAEVAEGGGREWQSGRVAEGGRLSRCDDRLRVQYCTPSFVLGTR